MNTFYISTSLMLGDQQVQPTIKSENEATVSMDWGAESFAEHKGAEHQREYLAAYKLQLKRMACPACAEDEPNS